LKEFLAEKLRESGCSKTLHFIEQNKLEALSFELLSERFPDFAAPSCVCLFPGRSADRIRVNVEWRDCYVRSVFNCDTFVSIHAERRFDRHGNPRASAGVVFPELTVCPRVRTVIVVDDVISTGVTMRACVEKNQHKSI
jgi:hypothetical protein